jgi:hypothetical protein
MSQLGQYPGTGVQGPLIQKEGLQSDRSRKGMPLAKSMDYAEEKNDFLRASDYSTTDFTLTEVDTDGDAAGVSAVAEGQANGVMVLTTNDNALDSLNMQSKIEAYQLAAGCPLHMEMRVKVDTASTVDMFAGLAVTDTTALDADDRIGFRIKDGAGSIFCQAAKDATETEVDSGVDAEDDTYLRLNMIYDGGSQVEYYINGNKVATASTNIPDDEQLCVTLHVKNGDAAASTLSADYYQVVQKRSTAADV